MPRGTVARGAGPRRWALAAGVALLLVPVLVWTVLHVDAARATDASLLGWVRERAGPSAQPLASNASSLLDSGRAIVAAAAVLLGAIVTRSHTRVGAVALVLAGPNVTTQALQPLFTDLRTHEVSGVIFANLDTAPSGHVTAAASLALAVGLAAPRRVRAAVLGVGLTMAIAISAAVLVRGTHFPVDVLAAWIVVLAWTCAAVAAEQALGSMRGERLAVRRATRVLAAAVLVPVIVFLGRAGTVSDAALWEHRAVLLWVVAGMTVLAVTLTLVTSWVLGHLQPAGAAPADVSPARPPG